MSIKLKESSMVCPSKETPKGYLWLSKLDMMRTPFLHTNVLFMFHHPNYHNTKTNNNNDSNSQSSPSISSSPKFFDTKILKESLSNALVPFYPMAGRLIFNDENGRYEIDCNAKGALFSEVETSQSLDDFGDYKRQDSQLRKLVLPICDYSGGLSSFPLLLVQLTRFNCGSVCLGFAQHHHVADGISHSHFINSWARLAKGLDLLVHPIHDRATYVAPRDPPQVKFRHLEYEPPLPPVTPEGSSGEMVTTTECMFKLTKDQMDALKLLANSQGIPPTSSQSHKLSSFVVQAGHVWRCVCKARGLPQDQDVSLNIPVDGRSRLKDRDGGLPQGYCGNLLFFTTCVEKAGDVACKPLSYAASKIHEALKKFEDLEYSRSAIDFLESHPNPTALTNGTQNTNSPNLRINSWARLPCYEADFGWGKPNFMGINAIKFEGQTYILPSSNGDGSFFVAIKLFTPHMELFKTYFYDF